MTTLVVLMAVVSAIVVSAGPGQAEGRRSCERRLRREARQNEAPMPAPWEVRQRCEGGGERGRTWDGQPQGEGADDEGDSGEAPTTTIPGPDVSAPTDGGGTTDPTTSPEEPPTTSPEEPPTTSPEEPPAEEPAPPTDATGPPGELPGWRQLFVDDFNGSSLDLDIWDRYYGMPGGDPGGWWEPSHVVVHDGMLDLQTYQDGGRWVSGGVSSAPSGGTTYGKVLVRFRMDAGYGVWGILMLFGAYNWPPEIDFAENGGETRARDYMASFLHYGAENNQIGRAVAADFTQWHTIGVEWTPGKIVYTLDGEAWATIEGDFVPAEDMIFNMQAQTGTCGDRWNPCPDETTPAQVNLQVDWAALYAMA